MKSDGARVYEGAEVTVTFDARRCVHNGHCVQHLPAVFDTAQRPWIRPDGAEATRVLEIVAGCPSGALRALRRDGTAADMLVAASPLQIAVTRNGPLFVRGAMLIIDANDTPLVADERVALCRCGLSQRKPFCDNSHRAAAWRDTPPADSGA
jgi:uncharacterized Fe-S cluster protein YjdI/CDGSH-type Zn-finger protein